MNFKLVSLTPKVVATLSVLLFATSCSDAINDAALTDDEISKIAQLQNPFERPLVSLATTNSQSDATFGMSNCRVYKAQKVNGAVVAWDLVIKPDFYLLPQTCDRESMRVEDGYLLVETGLISFGAGGCCSATGKYRTDDGINWQRYRDGAWSPMNNPKEPTANSSSE